MKEWMRRFGVLTILGALLCGALVAGCGGGGEDETDNTTNNAAPAKDKDGDADQ
jgi:hypothetical protein